jgi:hypothetical protein
MEELEVKDAEFVKAIKDSFSKIRIKIWRIRQRRKARNVRFQQPPILGLQLSQKVPPSLAVHRRPRKELKETATEPEPEKTNNL